MNIENLKRMADFVLTIPVEKFDMSIYRKDLQKNHEHECGTVGCILGHCTILDTEDNFNKYFINIGIMDFESWGENFTGLKPWSPKWDYMFGCLWGEINLTNTPEHASYRINKIINGFEPPTLSGDDDDEPYLNSSLVFKQEVKLIKEK